jgi:hypothetical protein
MSNKRKSSNRLTAALPRDGDLSRASRERSVSALSTVNNQLAVKVEELEIEHLVRKSVCGNGSLSRSSSGD